MSRCLLGLEYQSIEVNSRSSPSKMFRNPYILCTFAVLLCCLSGEAAPDVPHKQFPVDPTGLTTICSPGGIQIRYKEPGICETMAGVNSYSGYVDLDADTHIFFWFFEARHNPSEAHTTLWLTGGPGDDSLLATFLGTLNKCLSDHLLIVTTRERTLQH